MVIRRKRRYLLFGLLGMCGCLLGALAGEGVLTAARFSEGFNTPVLVLLQAVVREEPISGDDTDREMARRLRAHDARSGEVQVSLLWDGQHDLDLHVRDPRGEMIYFGHRQSTSGGRMDVDRNAGPPLEAWPLENLYWSRSAPQGPYTVSVDFYRWRGGLRMAPFTVYVHERGVTRRFSGVIPYGHQQLQVHAFDTREVDPTPTWVKESWWKRAPAGMLDAVREKHLLAGLLLLMLWGIFLALGLAFALVIGQNRFLGRPFLRKGQGRSVMLGALAAGTAAGGIAQLLFSVSAPPDPLAWWARLPSWLLLGGLLGLLLARVVPNLTRRAALIAGGIGGLLGLLVFLQAALFVSDALGRLLAAALLGFFIGLMIVLTEVEATTHELADTGLTGYKTRAHTLRLPRWRKRAHNQQ